MTVATIIELICSSCGSTSINLVRMPDYFPHYAVWRCAECDAFRSWEPKLENQAKRRSSQTKISQMVKSPHLSQWEREFLKATQQQFQAHMDEEVRSNRVSEAKTTTRNYTLKDFPELNSQFDRVEASFSVIASQHKPPYRRLLALNWAARYHGIPAGTFRKAFEMWLESNMAGGEG